MASSRLMARPRPVPPYLREVPASACWKASKIRRCLSGGHADAGVLDRERDHVVGVAQDGWSGDQPPETMPTRTSTWPVEVNFTALDSRFFRICCRRLGSLSIERGRSSAK
jgi:hypothetical protein